MRIIAIGLLALLAIGAADAGASQRGEHLRLAVGNHFTVSFDGPQEEELASKALESLEKAYWRVGQTLNTYPSTPVPVVLYTTEEFRDITRAPEWAAGSYDGTIRVPMRGALARSEELDRVLAHEFVHALIRTLARSGVPGWLNEGLAAALERESLDWARTRIARAGGLMSFDALGHSFGQMSAADADLAYATSAVAARTLLDEDGGVAVSNLLRDLGGGERLETAFLHRLGRTLPEFIRSLASSETR